MKEKGLNMASIKQSNRRNILKVLNNNGPLSRKDIAELVELTPAAVTILVNDMIEEGLIKEVGQLVDNDSRVGRKKILVDLDYNFKKVIGIIIGPDNTGIGIADLKGDIICEQELKTQPSLPATDFLKMVAEECVQILWKNNIMKGDILGVGVGIIGPVEPKKGISKEVYGLWSNPVPVKDILEENLELPVVLDNNVRCLARAELNFSAGISNGNILFIKNGPGIGATVLLNKEVYYGTHNIAAEIGHIIVKKNGNLCRCNQRGCLEAEASSEAIINQAKKALAAGETPALAQLCAGDQDRITLTEVFAVLEKDDVVAKIINQAVYYLAIGIFNAFQMYDPGLVILYGPIFSYQIFNQLLLREINQLNPCKNYHRFIKFSKLSSKKEYLGGISLAISHFYHNLR